MVAKHYELTDKIAKSPFYDVYRAQHKHNQTVVAVKIEQRLVSESKLLNEARTIRELRGEEAGDLGIPEVVEAGSDGNYNYLAMEMMGKSVDVIMADSGGRLELRLVIEIGLQVIDRLEFLHSRGFVHRDLRPEHFLFGRVKHPDKVYLAGLVLSKTFQRTNGRHVPYKDNKTSFTGTARFVSLNTHLGIEQSRRDDLEALINVMVFMAKGHLPWMGVKGDGRKEKYENIQMAKITTPVDIICKDMPAEFEELLVYCRTLEYEQQPDYQYMREALRKAQKQLARSEISLT